MGILEDLPRDRLIEVFGYATPRNREIEAYSDMVWRSSIKYRRNIRRTVMRSRVHGFMRDLGYYQILDFQIRDGQIRFSDEGTMGVAIVSGLDILVDNSPNTLGYWD